MVWFGLVFLAFALGAASNWPPNKFFSHSVLKPRKIDLNHEFLAEK
jgi:hypothetical protein